MAVACTGGSMSTGWWRSRRQRQRRWESRGFEEETLTTTTTIIKLRIPLLSSAACTTTIRAHAENTSAGRVASRRVGRATCGGLLTAASSAWCPSSELRARAAAIYLTTATTAAAVIASDASCAAAITRRVCQSSAQPSQAFYRRLLLLPLRSCSAHARRIRTCCHRRARVSDRVAEESPVVRGRGDYTTRRVGLLCQAVVAQDSAIHISDLTPESSEESSGGAAVPLETVASCTKGPLSPIFAYVCPEPVLAK
jgi:hypothetical protein